MRGHTVEIIEAGELTGYFKFISLEAHTAIFKIIPLEDDEDINTDIQYICSKLDN